MSEGEFKKRKFPFWTAFEISFEKQLGNIQPSKRFIPVDEAAKDISASIEAHIKNLVAFWKSSSEPYAQYYIDAYCCIRHNVLEDDAFKLKKWFGKFEE